MGCLARGYVIWGTRSSISVSARACSSGRRAQLWEGRVGALDADRVAGAVLELVEEAVERVAGLLLLGAAAAGFAGRLG